MSRPGWELGRIRGLTEARSASAQQSRRRSRICEKLMRKSSMLLSRDARRRRVHRLLLAPTFIALAISLFAQTAGSQQSDDVLRINTELVQTDVMVFDR